MQHRREGRRASHGQHGDTSPEEFRKQLHELADWIADFRQNLGALKVAPNEKPGAILAALPAKAPETGEQFETILGDIDRLALARPPGQLRQPLDIAAQHGIFGRVLGHPPQALQLLQERDEGADQNDPVALVEFGRIECIGPRQEIDPGRGAAAPAQLGERIQGGDAERAGGAVLHERLLHQLRRRAASEVPEGDAVRRYRAADVAGGSVARASPCRHRHRLCARRHRPLAARRRAAQGLRRRRKLLRAARQ